MLPVLLSEEGELDPKSKRLSICSVIGEQRECLSGGSLARWRGPPPASGKRFEAADTIFGDVQFRNRKLIIRDDAPPSALPSASGDVSFFNILLSGL